MSTLSATVRGLLVTLLVFGSLDVHAQDIVPEVMLLIDSSGSMQRVLDPEQRDPVDRRFPAKPICLVHEGTAPWDPRRPNVPLFNPNNHTISRLNAIKDVLAGSPVGAPTSPCWERAQVKRLHINDPENAQFDDYRSDLVDYNMRRLCCYRAIGDFCQAWNACASDHHGRFEIDSDPGLLTQEMQLFKTEGLIDQFSSRIKFGLLAMDGDPSVSDDSFGTDHTVDVLSVTQAEANRSVVASGFQRINIGAVRHHLETNPRSLVPGSQGLINDDRFDHLLLPIGEGEVDLNRHSKLIEKRLQDIVGWGFTPTSALLYDLDQYYAETAEGGIFADNYGECRSRTAILITGGRETNYYQAMTGGGEPLSHHPYPDPGVLADEMRERYPGLEIYVIGLDVDNADGNQGTKIGGDSSHYKDVNTVDELRTTLSRILDRVAAGGGSAFASKVTPVIVTPEQGDEFDDNVRQIRLTAYSVENESGDVYGRIYGDVYGCPDQRDNANTSDLEELPNENIDYAQTLGDQGIRTTLGRNPKDESNLMATGLGDSLFTVAGIMTGTAQFGAPEVRDLLFTPQPEAGRDPVQSAYRAIAGYFGSSGVFISPNGPAEDRTLRRQLGSILDGEILAVRPPSLGVQTPAYSTFREEQEERPTLVVGGARDGLIHFFRLDDGREVFSFVPRLAWDNFRSGLVQPGSSHLNADGPLHTADIVKCRSLGAGNAECPGSIDDLEFRTVVAGALGSGGANVFGIDITDATDFMLRGNDGGIFNLEHISAWDVINDERLEAIRAFVDRTTQEDKLGLSVSRPQLTHVRNQGEIHGAVIVGCGEAVGLDEQNIADENGTGRCVLVINATTGEVIRKISHRNGVEGRFTLDFPIVGSPAVYPQGGIQPAERAYVGDSAGRLWRIDLRAQDPAAWTMEVIWPPTEIADARNYQLGAAVVGRPSIATANNGNVVIVFGTGEAVIPEGTDIQGQQTGKTSYVVSLSDDLVVEDESIGFESKTNWLLPLRESEYVSGEVVVRSGIAYFTTIADSGGDVCASSQGRFYGVDFFRTQEPYATIDGRNIDVIPGLPILVTDQGQQVTDALSILLPLGDLAAGVSIVTSPSCSDEDAPVTQALLNVATTATRVGKEQPGDMRIERKTGEVVPGKLDRSLAKQNNGLLAIELSGKDAEGNLLGGAGVPGPFPRQVLYWGSSFGY